MTFSMTWDAPRPMTDAALGPARFTVTSDLWSRYTLAYDTVQDEVLAQMLDDARCTACSWASRAPPWMDREAFLGEALAGVATAIHRYRPDRGTTLSAYAAGSVYRALQHEWRRQARHAAGDASSPAWELAPLSLATMEDAGEYPDHRPGPEALALRRAQAERIRAAVDLLPQPQFFVIRRYFWEHVTMAQISRELGVSEPRVHQILHRVVTEIGRILIEEGWLQ